MLLVHPSNSVTLKVYYRGKVYYRESANQSLRVERWMNVGPATERLQYRRNPQ